VDGGTIVVMLDGVDGINGFIVTPMSAVGDGTRATDGVIVGAAVDEAA